MKSTYALSQVAAVLSIIAMVGCGLMAFGQSQIPDVQGLGVVYNTGCFLAGIVFLLAAIVAGTIRANRGMK